MDALSPDHSAMLPVRDWRAAYASVAGTSHVRTGLPCQDASGCRVLGPVLVAAVADGAGSVPLAAEGAQLTVERFLTGIGDAAQADPALDFLTLGYVRDWLAALRMEMMGLGEAPLEDYACTLLGAVIGEGVAVFVQIGDGAIVTSEGEGLDWVFWPQNGEFANSTCFVTQDDAADILMYARREVDVMEVALFSDGIERLVIDLAARKVHAPALRPILDWLATSDAAADAPSPALLAYLGSAHVTRRTDDDTTLVIATRAALAVETRAALAVATRAAPP